MGTKGTVMGLVALVALGCTAQAQAPNPEAQIASALQAAPEDRREAATVIGFNDDGTSVTLREGTNDMVCLADYPLDDGWSTACYHESLEPYMARGREMREQGIEGRARVQQRWAEIEAGTLEFPMTPTMLHVLHGDGFDPATGEVINPYLRWVIYVPNATAESTGLQTTPSDRAPWLMLPGTIGAHIMITPPQGGGEESGG
jgi:hypothetical protein